MLDSVRKLKDNLVSIKKAFDRLKPKQVRSKKYSTLAKNLVDQYFRDIRPTLVDNNLPILVDCDDLMQSLLETANKASASSTYKRIFKSLDSILLKVETHELIAIGNQQETMPHVESVDKTIVSTLQHLIPSAAAAYEQGLRDLGSTERISWRGTAVELRETLRECLDKLAPDNDVKNQSGFQLEPNTKGPTMKQKTRYVLRSRGLPKNMTKATEDAVSGADELVGSFVRSTYTRANISTHTMTTRAEVSRLAGYVRVALCDLLEISI